MRCPHCKNKIVQQTGDRIRIRSDGPIEFTNDGVCHTKCHWCKGEIELPIQLKDKLTIPSERFILSKP